MYNILKINLGDKEAKALIEYLESHVEKSFEKEIYQRRFACITIRIKRSKIGNN